MIKKSGKAMSSPKNFSKMLREMKVIPD